MGPNEMLRAAAIARRYFLEGKAKTEIAQEFNMSRFRVARILDECLDSGLVQITITLPAQLDVELSEKLRTAYHLNHALVVEAQSDDEVLRAHLGRVAADLLQETVTDDDVLGIGWGRTLNAVVDHLTRLAPCPVVQLTGVVGSVSDNSMELIRRVTAVSGGRAYPIYAPLLLPDAVTAAGLRRQSDVAAATSQFTAITKAVVAVGSWEPPDSQLRAVMPPRERERLRALGVRAEVCGALLSADGELVGTDVPDRMIAITTEQLAEVPEVIVVAGGASKAAAVGAVLRGGFANSVVTDAAVARVLLDGLAGDLPPHQRAQAT